MSEKDPPFLMDAHGNRVHKGRTSPGRRADVGPGSIAIAGASGKSASMRGNDLPAKAARAAPQPPAGAPLPEPPEPFRREAPAESSGGRAGRARALCGHLDATLEQVQHARSNADQLFALICDLEAEAKLSRGLEARLRKRDAKLEEKQLEAERLAQKRDEMSGELARTRDALARCEAAREEAEEEARTLGLQVRSSSEENTALVARISAIDTELVSAQAALEKAEVEGSSLRAMLAERENTARALQIREAELRMAGERDASLIAELTQAAQRKEARIAELGTLIERGEKRIEDLEERHERALDEQRTLEARQSELQITADARAYALTGSLEQEQAGHRVTRKLLEEMRSSCQRLTDENRQLKEQSLALAQENQQMKIELGGTRGTIREYGERLGELNLRYCAAQDDVARLEASLADARKDMRSLKRRAGKVDDLQDENATLHEKIRGLQQSLDHYRAGREGAGDEPIVLTARRNHAPAAGASSQSGREPKPSATISKLPRAQ